MSRGSLPHDCIAIADRRAEVLAEARKALSTVRMYLDSVAHEIDNQGDEVRVLFEIGQAAEYLGAADRRLAVWRELGEILSSAALREERDRD